MLSGIVQFFLTNRPVTFTLLLLLAIWGWIHAPFEWSSGMLPRDPVPVDAIPDIGENQQIVYTSWPGKSPQDVENQISYPLSAYLLGISGVKSIRSTSMFGFSSVYVIFEDDVEYYWSRSRILEKLAAVPTGILPEGVKPELGPDATALGQIFWYTLEGRDPDGNPAGGWTPQELRSLQDFYVKYALTGVPGVAEVASIGGFVKEYQVDADPDAMRMKGVGLPELAKAIQQTNLDVGARTLELNSAEYFVRGLGYVETVEDIEETVVKVVGDVPIRIRDVARVQIGPAERRGILDKSGAEAVGGVVVARYGSNPMAVIEDVKSRIADISKGLPVKVLEDGTLSQVTVVPFYDRSDLIRETIATLEESLTLEILVTTIVVVLMLLHFGSAILIAATLPIAVLMCFIAMKFFGVDANIVALSGIAIAIGTMVDMGTILTESILRRLEKRQPEESVLSLVVEGTLEVGSAVLTAVATTVVSFLPVFAMEAAEGKLFQPLAYTKTFALMASILVSLIFLPALTHVLFAFSLGRRSWRLLVNGIFLAGGLGLLWAGEQLPGLIVSVAAFFALIQAFWKDLPGNRRFALFTNILLALLLIVWLAEVWSPLGAEKPLLGQTLFVGAAVGSIIGFFYLLMHYYEPILRFCLRYKFVFLLLTGFMVYQGFVIFRNTGEEFLPALDEGAFLLMPTAMPHAGVEENIRNLKLLDMAVTAIPEVEQVVGKAGRVESALDPAPLSMYENVILYKSEYLSDEQGKRLRFAVDQEGNFLRDSTGQLVPDRKGAFFRQWRSHIRSPEDIWDEIVQAVNFPGVTSAPKLQPIETRLVMLQTGMRAPMGIKVKGNDLKTMEEFGLQLEKHLKSVEGVKTAAVFAERVVGKPYLEIDIDRVAISRYGLRVLDVQNHIQTAIGGMALTETIEGRERYKIRLRYARELRNEPEMLGAILVSTPGGKQIPLSELVDIRYEQGPQMIKSEDGFLVAYVLFDKTGDYSEVEVVEACQQHLESLINTGTLQVPPGLTYTFAGNYQQQQRATQRLYLLLPLALGLIFMILYLQFRSVLITTFVFAGVFVAFAGGFITLYLYGQDWFLNVDFLGANLRELFQMQTIYLSVAVWVGFLALFGIATDDGVLVATFIQQRFREKDPSSIAEIREMVVEGGQRRVRPALMTTATTILALLPVLTSTGKGADIMIPMAIPSFGGMLFQTVTMFTVPVLYALWKEWQWRLGIQKKERP